ncbi:MAG: DNA translocase FtsK 4TM domain-containing protein [Clostridia bacterium]|nr:DNA translocase FtsK 4TM domain-containing protein [Clostridia bacterium]
MSKQIEKQNGTPGGTPSPRKTPPRASGEKENIPALKGFQRAVPVILCALALFIGISFFASDTGTVGRFIRNALYGLFSFGAYLIPFLLILHAVFYASDTYKKRRLSRLIFSILTLVFFCSTVYAIKYFGQDVEFLPKEYYAQGTELKGGGLIGSVVAFGITKLCGSVGLIIITLMILALYITFFFAREGNSMMRFGIRCLTAILTFFSKIEKWLKSVFSPEEKAKKRKSKVTAQKQRELMEDEFFDVDDGLERLEIPALGIAQVRDARSQEENPMLHDRVIHEDGESVGGSFTQGSVLEDMVNADAYEAFIIDDIPSTFPSQQEDTPIIVDAEPTAPVHGEMNAEEAFGADFDAFDIARNQEILQRSAPKAPEGTSSVLHETIDNITPEEIEQMRRRQEFERRKASIISEQGPQRVASAQTEGSHAQSVSAHTHETTREQEPVRPEAQGYAPREEFLTPESYAHIAQIVREAEEVQPIDTTAQRSKVSTFTFGEEPTRRPLNADGESFTLTIDKTPKSAPEEVEVAPPKPEAPLYRESESTVFTRGDKGTGGEFSFDATSEDDPFLKVAEMVAREEGNAQMRTEPVVPRTAEATPSVTQSPKMPEDTSAISAVVREFETEQGAGGAESAQGTFIPSEWTTSGFYEQNERSRMEVTREIIEEPVYEEEEEESPLDFIEGEDEEEDGITPEVSPEEDVTDAYIPPEEQNPMVHEQRNLFAFLRGTDPNAEPRPDEQPPEATEQVSAEAIEEEDIIDADTPTEAEEDAPPFDGATRTGSSRFAEYVSSMSRPTEERPKPKEEPREKPVVDYSNYKFPPIDLLKAPPPTDDADAQIEINDNGEKLIDTLESFRVQATIKGYDRGPRITRYEVVPARGVKVSAITNLFDNISLALAADGVRMEAPIPGKSAIGFEIPNKKPSNVYLRDLIESEEFRSSESKTLVCMGKDVAGMPIYGDIAKMPHVLVAGATGMGKSVCINAMMLSILFRARPDEVKLIMIDPKKVEFQPYNGIPHLLVPVVIDPKQAAGALMWAVDEMEKRFDLIEQMRVKKIDDYNAKVRENPELGTPMPKIIIVIDELNDLMIQVRDPVENLIMRIAQKARAAGIHLIIGTQRPSVNVITGVIKANIPSRISCKVASAVDSRTILEMTGAEKLLDRGDMLFFPVTRQKPLRVQGAFVSDTEVDNILDFLRAQAKGQDSYDADVLEQINRAASKCSKSKGSDADDDDDDGSSGEGYLNDQTFLDAVKVALHAGKISTSLLQRKLSIGFGRAAKYIDIMEDLGVVGEKNGQKPRDVLISMQEWEELLSRRSLD